MSKTTQYIKKAVSPQAENGHLRIASEVVEAMYQLQLSGSQWRLLLVILRQTWGWKKKTESSFRVDAEDNLGPFYTSSRRPEGGSTDPARDYSCSWNDIFSDGEWHSLEIHVKMNTPGENDTISD